MKAGACGFPECVQSFDVGDPEKVRENTAAEVVGRGYDWNRHLGDVDPEVEAALINHRKTLFQKIRSRHESCVIEEYTGRARCVFISASMERATMSRGARLPIG